MIDLLNSTLGIIVSILTLTSLAGGSIYYYLSKGNNKGKVSNDNNFGQNTTIIGDGNTIISSQGIPSKKFKSDDDIKSYVQILFIDDEDFNVVRMLKKAGWKNIKRKPDFSNLDDIDLRNSDVVFVDIKGVGIEGGYKNEGIGLAAAIKKKYPAKGVILYSGTHEHDIFCDDLKVVDDTLPKNAEPIQFSYLIERYGRKKD